jgi:chromosome segregation ATPase
MALKIPAIPRVSEGDQLLSWEAELDARWSQLQARRRKAEQLRERQILLEASLRELDNENVAAELILEERRRALSVRRTQLQQSVLAHKEEMVRAAAEAEERQQAVEEETHSIDAAWRELERASAEDDAAHVEELRALHWSKQRSLQCELEARARLDKLREREALVQTRLDAQMQRKRRSTELLRQTLAQLQRELNERQALLFPEAEHST